MVESDPTCRFITVVSIQRTALIQKQMHANCAYVKRTLACSRIENMILTPDGKDVNDLGNRASSHTLCECPPAAEPRVATEQQQW